MLLRNVGGGADYAKPYISAQWHGGTRLTSKVLVPVQSAAKMRKCKDLNGRTDSGTVDNKMISYKTSRDRSSEAQQ